MSLKKKFLNDKYELDKPGIKKVLFVDDEELILKSLDLLFRRDYKVFTAIDGFKALDIIRNNDIQVVVSDQNMPEMTGTELLSKIKGISPSTMRILLTGYSDLSSVMDSINEGEIFRFIHKPWSNKEIKATIAFAVESSKGFFNGIEEGKRAEVKALFPENAKLDSSETKPAKSSQILPGRQNIKAKPKINNHGVIVIDREDRTFKIANQLYNPTQVHHLKNVYEAFTVLPLHNIGVLIIEIDDDRTNSIALIKTLKRVKPEICVIVCTRIHDSNLAINLINEAQIFRYLPKDLMHWKVHLKAYIYGADNYFNKSLQDDNYLKRFTPKQISTKKELNLTERFIQKLKDDL